MKVESWLFILIGLFFIPVGTVYGFMVGWHEHVGYLALYLLAGMCLMIGAYSYYTGNRVGPRPEDRVDAEVHEGSGEQGHFSPWSWWPLVLGLAAASGFMGLAVGWWIVFFGAGLAVIALVGWVYEYSRGDHAH
ncbi:MULTISPECIES: cytochrome c oxidase subunit 4 [unclassified Arthrobacter]|uniref:cytochrome c oxidase subunit 4 n=1 Tax=unclassified Arthrobacter TaxID=235627 RepID=UPI00159E7B0D|nr:cytochrome c oxidase subunit 4 [Arthrobacter sp. STN4]MCQ9164433.1 cytochrome c oxidase subunit 4 [Arthrobacter sp. STN4]NVM97977.1 cytochrome c oxidase subunit 4 [Arthrobacter sp. SDTb3-6]